MSLHDKLLNGPLLLTREGVTLVVERHAKAGVYLNYELFRVSILTPCSTTHYEFSEDSFPLLEEAFTGVNPKDKKQDEKGPEG